VTAWLLCALLALVAAWAGWRLHLANRTVDQILADHRRLQQGRPARYARGCEELRQCIALLRGDDEPDRGGR
jgi:hypothetical protein